MTLKNPKDINLYKEDDRTIKKYKKLNRKEKEEDNNDSILENDDSDMKIFKMK